jgi:Tol biopolymer transport system component
VKSVFRHTLVSAAWVNNTFFLSRPMRRSDLPTLMSAVFAICAAVAFTGSPAWGEPREKTREKIVFTNTSVDAADQVVQSEIYIMNTDGTEPIRLTNDGFGDGLPALSPDEKGKIVFDSNRIAISVGGTQFDSDLFLMNADGTADGPLFPRPLTRGSSASFDPTGKIIAFHRSASGTYGTRIAGRPEPGGPTTDSDIFLARLGDLLEGVLPVNLTNGLTSTPGVRGPYASDDADFSPDGKWIAFTSRIPNVPFSQSNAGIYVMNLTTGALTKLTNLTNSGTEERSPAWSPDSRRIAFMRRRDVAPTTFEIWVLGLSVAPFFETETITVETETRLTDNLVADLSPAWSRPTGEEILFHTPRPPATGIPPRPVNQIFVMNADGSNQRALTGVLAPPGALLTGSSLFPKWGRVKVGQDLAPK